MKNSKSDILNAYKEQVDCSKDSESDSYDNNEMKEKVNDLAWNDLNIGKTRS